MGKNRKKIKRSKIKRYKKWSDEAPMNSGPTPAGLGDGLKPVPSLLRKEQDLIRAQLRQERNEAMRTHIREWWMGPRHQGTQGFYRQKYFSNPVSFSLDLLFSGHKWIWMYENYQTGKCKFSIVYPSREMAVAAMQINWRDENSRIGIVWKMVVDIDES